MNRTFKFRAWDKKNNRMLPPEDIWNFGSDYCYGYYFGSVSELELEDKNNLILMQMTDEKDHDGREIYEGDILEDLYGQRKTYVKWGKAYSGFQFNEYGLAGDDLEDFYGGISANYKKVIGNIYENNK